MFYSSCVVSGEIDENCMRSECACCVNNHCGQGPWFPDQCLSGCIDGHRGIRCYELCFNNCKSCPNRADECTSCYDGFFYLDQTNCYKCPDNCKTCSSSTNCTRCKEGFQHSVGSHTCDHSICPANCECNQGDCIACKKGYYGIKGSCNKTCPINCVSCLSSEKCLECRDGYYNGNGVYGGSRILLNNCTHQCLISCVNCSSDDNCLQCPNGKHGLQCQKVCSAGCKDNTCSIEEGQCNCSPNFSGKTCTECISAKFGDGCERNCPENCKYGICDKFSGHCTDGCTTDHIIGDECNRCVSGMYGYLCEKACPENCKERKCEKDNGHCFECKDNFNGTTCEDCIKGKYENECKLDCSSTCENKVCEKQTGMCIKCIANFEGEKCNQCIPGLYGENCDKNCSPNCLNATCDKPEGTCEFGCNGKYSGDKCCAYSKNCVHCSSNTECRECKNGYFQTQCEEKCSKDCLGSCDFSTGYCNDCMLNKFGLLCDLTCPENCNDSKYRDTSKCASRDGACTFGCKDGFFGRTCNETCKSFCIDSVCRQDTGKCIKGCRGSNNDPVCEGEFQDESSDNSTILVATTATFATLFALTTTALCILIVKMKKIVKKMRPAHKQSQESEFEVNFESSLEGNQNLQDQGETADSVDEIVAYEIIDRTKDSHEHVYEAADQHRTERLKIAGNKQYENLQL